jgi:hypothetical protein
MTAKNRILGTLAGTVILFLLGWVFYGMLLMDFFSNNVGSAGNVMRTDDQMVWWALILGNMFQAYLLVYVFSKTNVGTFSGGLKQGGFIGLILGLGFNLTMYATTNMGTLTSSLVDPFVSAAMMGIAGGVIGMIAGKK